MRNKRLILTILLITAAIAVVCASYLIFIPFISKGFHKITLSRSDKNDSGIEQARELLRQRKDEQAGKIFSRILEQDPDNLDARWGIAEIFRRKYEFGQSKPLLEAILRDEPSYCRAKISLAYILSKEGDKRKALGMVKSIIRMAKNKQGVDYRDLALAFMLLGSINADMSSESLFLNKINYGLRIRSNFERARNLSPDLPEVHLGLGTFYLRAPRLFGGNISKAIEEFQTAIGLAPDFATPHARLAEAYLKKGDNERFKKHLNHALKLDPRNKAGLKLLNQNEK